MIILCLKAVILENRMMLKQEPKVISRQSLCNPRKQDDSPNHSCGSLIKESLVEGREAESSAVEESRIRSAERRRVESRGAGCNRNGVE